MMEGTVYFVMGFGLWPPLQSSILSEQKLEHGFIKILVHPAGHLEVIIHDDDGSALNYHTQCIHIEGAGMVIISAKWKSSNIRVTINGHNLLSLGQAGSQVYRIATTQPEEQTQRSFDHPDAVDFCSTWMLWRRTAYGPAKPHPGKDRRLKSEVEQFNELRQAIVTLGSLVNTMQQGNQGMLPFVAASLRSLVFWPKNKNLNYNPLLLRLAGRLNLPLPVYVSPLVPLPDIVVEAAYHYSFGISIRQQRANQQVIDIQEWLEREVQTERFPHPEDSTTTTERTLTLKEAIFETANTLGGAHYDDDVPLSIDRLQQSIGCDQSMLSHIMLKTALAVSELGGYITDTMDAQAMSGATALD